MQAERWAPRNTLYLSIFITACLKFASGARICLVIQPLLGSEFICVYVLINYSFTMSKKYPTLKLHYQSMFICTWQRQCLLPLPGSSSTLLEGKARVAEVIELTSIHVKGDNNVSTKCDYINNCLSEKQVSGFKGGGKRGDGAKCERLTTGMCGISRTSGRRSCSGTVYQPPIIEYWSCHSNERGPRHPMLLY